MEDSSHTNAVQIPAELVIGETTFVVKDTPELKTFVNAIMTKAQQTEKTKLYDKIKKLESDLIQLAQEKTNVENELANIAPTKNVVVKTKESMIEELKKENAKPLTAEDIAAIIDKKFSESLPEILKKTVDPISKRLEESEKAQIASYREKRLAELGDIVVPELVTGNTKEEIEQSIVESSTIRQRYVQAAPVAPTQPIAVSEVPASNPAPRTLPPALKRPVELREKEPEDIKAMSLGEFGTKREELLRAITKENVYPNLTQ